MFNSSVGYNPYMGGNFIDVIFRQVMDNGLKSISIVLVLQMCMYLSLEKVKDAIKWLVLWIYSKALELFNKMLLIQFTITVPSDVNEYVRCVSTQDKPLQMAFGDYVLQILSGNKSVRKVHISTDKNIRTIHIEVPHRLEICKKHYKVEFIQNFTWKLELQNAVLKNSLVNESSSEGVINVSLADFQNLLKMPQPMSTASIFICNNYWDPTNFYQGYCGGLIFYLIYTQNWSVLTAFYKFTQQQGTFTFNGKVYKIIHRQSLHATDEKTLATVVEVLKEKLPKFVSKDNTKTADDFIEKYKHLIEASSPQIRVFFTSETLSVHQLETKCDKLINKVTEKYFSVKAVESNNKITIYQTLIKYDSSAATPQTAETPTDTKPSKKKFEYLFKEPEPKVECRTLRTCCKPMKNLLLEKDAKKLLKSYLYKFKHDRAGYEKASITYKGGILLYGAPGCGKTSTIIAIATYLNKSVYYIDLNQLKSDMELEMCIDNIKKLSRNGAVVIFEDIDAVLDVVRRRDTKFKTIEPQKKQITLACLLNLIDGTTAPEEFIFVITTNHPEQLDPALIRPGRMDICIEIKRCNRYQLRKAYLSIYNEELPEYIVSKFPEYKYSMAEVIMHLFHNTYNKIPIETLMARFI